MTQPRSILLFAAACFFMCASAYAQKGGWTKLYNGKNLDGWNTYLAPDRNQTGDTVGTLNNDQAHVISVVSEGNEKIIRISGEQWGAISTKSEYENYHLRLMFKWGKLTWGEKKGKKMDSGLLYHSVGPYGMDAKAWMRSQEFQIQQGDCGDYWGVAGGQADVPATKKSDSEYVYDPAGQMLTFSPTSPYGRHCIKAMDVEKPSGEWNTVDLYCHGDTSVHCMNGKTVMVLYHSQQADNGSLSPLTKGKFQLQSEGAEIFYKKISVEPINEIPADVLR